MAERIQRSRAKGSHLPAGAVVVTRPGPWGNPFVVGKPNGLGFGDVVDAAHAVWLFSRWLHLRHDLVLFEPARHAWILTNLQDLRGHDLACWCDLGSPCHADVYLELLAAPVNSTCTSGFHALAPALGPDGEQLPPRRVCSGNAWDDLTGAPPCTCPCHQATS